MPRKHDWVEHRARVTRLSRIREILFGMQDGIITALALTAGMVGATNNNFYVVLVGLLGIVSGVLSMSAGTYLANKAQQQVFRAEIERERREIKGHPEEERAEMTLLFQEDGVAEADARVLANVIAKYDKALLRTMAQKELGLDVVRKESPLRDAVAMGLGYAAAGVVPLLPYLFLGVSAAFPLSVALTLATLFVMGAAKARLSNRDLLPSGLEILVVGSAVALVTYFVGSWVPAVLGLA